MRSIQPSVATLLPHEAPTSPYRRLLLFGIRRMGAGGIGDAHAAHAIFTGFGLAYRRPLILLRALMAELARVSAAQIKLAPCCCPRMTHDEATLLQLIAQAPAQPRSAHSALARLLRVHSCLGALTSAEAVGTAFSDLGMPLDNDCNNCNRDGSI